MLYPLQFQPLLKRYLWGGRRLGELLGKPLGDAEDYAESWEVVDHPDGQSVVANGPLAGQTLRTIVEQHGPELFGRHHPQASFPLLFKFLDCQRHLSVQVHPNDQQAALQQPPDLGKTEAWVILDARPGSVIYAGLKRGFDRAALAREINTGNTESCLHKIEPQVGDCIFIPAGTVHALGAGLVVAEIQQASNTTYRLFDWNRVDDQGRGRPLHIEQALDVIAYQRGPVQPQRPVAGDDPACQLLVDCDKFVLERWELAGDRSLGNDQRFHLLAVLSGEITLDHEFLPTPLSLGNTVLIPACCADLSIRPASAATLLHVVLPV